MAPDTRRTNQWLMLGSLGTALLPFLLPILWAVAEANIGDSDLTTALSYTVAPLGAIVLVAAAMPNDKLSMFVGLTLLFSPLLLFLALALMTKSWSNSVIANYSSLKRALLYCFAAPGLIVGLIAAAASVVGLVVGIIVLFVVGGAAKQAAKGEVSSIQDESDRTRLRDDVRRAINDSRR